MYLSGNVLPCFNIIHHSNCFSVDLGHIQVLWMTGNKNYYNSYFTFYKRVKIWLVTMDISPVRLS